MTILWFKVKIISNNTFCLFVYKIFYVYYDSGYKFPLTECALMSTNNSSLTPKIQIIIWKSTRKRFRKVSIHFQLERILTFVKDIMQIPIIRVHLYTGNETQAISIYISTIPDPIFRDCVISRS